jgi:uncharacterized protein (DUF1697 family)
MFYVALLRGINVGGNNQISMPELAKVFVELGFNNVKSYINSGNIVFGLEHKLHDTEISEQIEEAIHKKFKLKITVFIRNQEEIARISALIPDQVKNNQETKADVLFLSRQIDSPEIVPKLDPKANVDNIIYTPGAVIWYLAKKDFGRSGMNKLVGTKLYANMTVRNVNTVRKLNQLLSQQN